MIIYNPRAGRLGRRGTELLARAETALRRAGHNLVLTPTTGPGTAGSIVRQSIAQGADLILVAGGDGTINEAAEGLVRSAVPLGILPAGTANVLATEMGLGSKFEAAAASVDRWVPRRISIGRLQYTNGKTGTRHFLLMAGVGLDAQIVYSVNGPLKARWGKLAYWVGGFGMLGHALEEFQVEVEGHVRTCTFALASKVRNYGGDLEIARQTSLLDDTFEVVLFEGSSFRYLKYLTGIAARRLEGMKGVSVFRSRKISLAAGKNSQVYIQVDGEFAGRLPGTLEIVPDALTLLMPLEYARKHRPNRDS